MDNKKATRNNRLRWIAIMFVSFIAGCSSLPASLTDSEPTDSVSSTEVDEATLRAERVAAARESDNVWDRIRAGYGLAELDSPLIARHERWFASNPAYIERMVKRASLYLYHIVEEVEKRDIPMEIALLPAIESAYKAHAYSRARASGLWQFIPSTGRLYGLNQNWWYDGRRDVMAATDAALNYLQKLEKDFDGNWHLALAAYNAGEGRIMRARKHNAKRGRSTEYTKLYTLKPETLNYVPKLIAISNIIADPQKYGIELPVIPNEPYFTQVDVGGQIDMSILAKKADIPIGDLYDINPGFSRWATAPNGPYHLLVPTDHVDKVITALAELPPEQRIKYARHKIRHGQTLSSISRKFRVGVRAIKQANRLRSSRIRAGRNLLIPLSSRRITASVAGNVTRPIRRKPAKAPVGHVALMHKVRPGDTLWSIATRYNVFIYQITRWNAISRRSVLRLGQSLKIWIKPGKTPGTAALSTPDKSQG
ncbi:MAG: transglycosylase SLT domain-containing protein [Proteobacteria bacterium]|nr:transglycosylase SLT domain-containing protein [Pseudomonadota bacterium]